MKPKFEHIKYDGQHICFPVSGNDVGSLHVAIDGASDLACKITYIHPEKELVTWMMVNVPETI